MGCRRFWFGRAEFMADYRRILVLLLERRSYRDVVEIAGCSHRDVARVSGCANAGSGRLGI